MEKGKEVRRQRWYLSRTWRSRTLSKRGQSIVFDIEEMGGLTIAAIAFQHHSLDTVLRLDLLRECLGRGFVVGVVDGYVRSFGGELAGDFCS